MTEGGGIQATIKGVHPILSFISIFGEFDNSSCTIPKFEVVAAQWSGVRPSYLQLLNYRKAYGVFGIYGFGVFREDTSDQARLAWVSAFFWSIYLATYLPELLYGCSSWTCC
jgi:hypothetical protein